MNYTKQNNTYFTVPKDDPKDRLNVEIGDEKQDDFYPQVKIKRWDNEVNFSVRLIHDEKAPKVSKSGDKIKWKGKKVETEFYPIEPNEEHPEGGHEFEIILKEKPVSNKIEFTLQTKGLDFFYQPELMKQEIKDGAERPENVVGSYAVYCSGNKTNYVGGKLYRSGKVGHIFRPKITDSVGSWIWGELSIDIENGILTVTIPQIFLNRAIYPIRHAAGLTFGYTTAGSSNKTSPRANGTQGSLFTTSGQSGTVTDINISCAKGTSATTIKGAIYAHAAKPTLITNALSGANSVTDTAQHWETLTFSTNPTISDSTGYVLASGVSTGLDTAKWYYDAGSANQGHSGTTAVGTATWTDGPGDVVHSTDKYSIYCTYTVAGGTAWTKNLTDSATPTDSLSKSISLSKSDSTTPSDQLNTTFAGAWSLNLSDSATPTDVLKKTLTKAIADSTTPTEAIAKAIVVNKTDSATPSEALAKAVSIVKSDSATPTDQVNITFAGHLSLSLSDSVTVSDVLTPISNFVKELSDTATITEGLTAFPNYITGNYMVYQDSKLYIIVNGNIAQIYS